MVFGFLFHQFQYAECLLQLAHHPQKQNGTDVFYYLCQHLQMRNSCHLEITSHAVSEGIKYEKMCQFGPCSQVPFHHTNGGS